MFIFSFFKAVYNLILKIFSRMKVLFLILILIFLMIVFLLVQGYTGLKIIDNMQGVTQEMFASSIKSNENVSYIRNILTNIKITYLERLRAESDINIPFDLNTMINHVRILQTADQTAAVQFEEEMNQLKLILDEPINEVNYNRLSKTISAAMINLENLEAAVRRANMESMGFGNEFIANSRKNTIIILIISTLISSVFGFLIATSISRPLRAIVKAANSLANGDLSQTIEALGCREAVSVVRELNHAIDRLREVLSLITKTSEQVKVAAQQISIANQDLSERTQEQAATLEEFAATMEEVNVSIEQVSNNSAQANQTSQITLEAVNEGEKTIRETLESMTQILASSNQISEILKFVNEISFQINLLALNAAVEAARAGEQGRGFAVVAAEIRNLSNKTSDSAKKIEQLIKESANRIQQGNLLAEKSTSVLRQIVDNTKETAELISQSSLSLKQQFAASLQIQTSIEQLNQVTQQNAAMVEENSAASQALYHEAEKLRELISQFVIE
ncbi:MAG: methyl-accepting chemotaxis protein [Firmicutes bacterium]|nr:methyl-accepting chemotaxis protein [Bacillota bacterium]